MAKNKYFARKVTVGGKVFDSKKEAERYQVLSAMEKAGAIQDLQCQVKFELIPAQYEEIAIGSSKSNVAKTKRKCVERKVEYKADFVYTQNGELVVEDVKGFRNGEAYKLFVIKRKLMLKVHGIKVKEI